VLRWRKNFPNLREDEFIENIPYPETREYVKKVLAAMEVYRQLYGLEETAATLPSPAPSQEKTAQPATRELPTSALGPEIDSL